MELHVLLHSILFLAGAALALTASRRSRNREVILAFLVAYGIRVLVTLFIYWYSPSGLFFLDDRGYDSQGSLLAAWPTLSISVMQAQIGTFHIGYPLMLSYLYSYIGHSILSAELLNAAFGAATVPIAYLLAHEVTGDEGIARGALWISAVFLYDIAWGSFLLKDTALLFLVTAAVLFGVRAITRRSVVAFVAFAAFVSVISVFRYYAAATLVIAFGIAVAAELMNHVTRWQQRWVTFVVAAAIVAAIGWQVTVWFTRHTILGGQFAAQDISEDLYQAGYTPLVFSPSLDYVIHVIRAVLVYFLGPFPWVFYGIEKINYIFYPGMYLLYILVPLFVVGLWHLIRELRPIGIFIASIILVHAGVEVYAYQGGERQRMMTDVLFILCAAVGWRLRPKTANVIRAVYAALLALMFVQLSTQLF